MSCLAYQLDLAIFTALQVLLSLITLSSYLFSLWYASRFAILVLVPSIALFVPGLPTIGRDLFEWQLGSAQDRSSLACQTGQVCLSPNDRGEEGQRKAKS